ncbi:hypothetical protein Rsub_04142 [Raphidocelis subcapitata]|uniref:Uncharacterized protein n=1 Tax=Raphidocelis subcapitata TaxID=307507 RepID=A0A2V0NXK2_9CHLO|nr:hypothetical protein Rsub_04142 [Raphidocelis subcapitata]|eukprot:GBF91402.1 hypothetical protein Rsub_04142 [Raphidocelis subcapitata]
MLLQRLAGPLAGLLAAQGGAGAPAAAAAATQHAAAAAVGTALALARGPWPPAPAQQCQHQQARAFAAAKGKQQQKGGGKGKKGAPAVKKKQKQRLDVKPFDDKDPLLQRVVALLAPQERPPPPSEAPEAAAEARARAKAYSAAKMREHQAWRADLHGKLQLKRAALRALPQELRAAAEEEDLAPFPLTRHALYETPPESYRDK